MFSPNSVAKNILSMIRIRIGIRKNLIFFTFLFPILMDRIISTYYLNEIMLNVVINTNNYSVTVLNFSATNFSTNPFLGIKGRVICSVPVFSLL